MSSWLMPSALLFCKAFGAEQNMRCCRQLPFRDVNVACTSAALAPHAPATA